MIFNNLKKVQFEIHIFGCGQGDTILVNLMGKWFLIDCFLPDRKTKDAFFDYIEKRKISAIECIFLTHPHYDHYAGMFEVIEYFRKDGKELKWYCDTGISWKVVDGFLKAIKEPSGYINEYHRLSLLINRLAEEGKYKHAGEDTAEYFRSESIFAKSRLLPLGPNPTTSRDSLTKPIRGKAFDLNRLSLILAIEVRILFKSFVVLLTGDMDGAGLATALDVLRSRYKIDKSRISIVKVAHHGSMHSHDRSPIPNVGLVTKDPIAIISAGDSYAVLPDRKVMQDYLGKKWKLFLTSHRLRPLTAMPDVSEQMMMLGTESSYEGEFHLKRYSIVAQINRFFSLICNPEDAKITLTDLKNYKSALD